MYWNVDVDIRALYLILGGQGSVTSKLNRSSRGSKLEVASKPWWITWSFSDPPIGAPHESRRESKSGRWQQPENNWKQDELPTPEDYRAESYNHYCDVAGKHDKEFLKKYDQDLNTTLIFAGLLSAVTSAFIIQVNSQLQPNSGDQTTALLCLLIYKIDNTTFGNVPTPPLWGGPSWTTVLAQILLVISLASSLFSAFLVVLGKEWLGHYESTNPRETVINTDKDTDDITWPHP
ncbi:hypothetical protein BJ322DRAFT_1111455 [Thelephora terrestris]|uniref:DUF6535 domain-containing protein n=1 Tax=Thelephora terrestris TaxID=56493 RepID=A0A9P6HA67_9AGAM|nr:hypothetical protein BJ322DRAFT_1111455 [Thelephora terrestris]